MKLTENQLRKIIRSVITESMSQSGHHEVSLDGNMFRIEAGEAMSVEEYFDMHGGEILGYKNIRQYGGSANPWIITLDCVSHVEEGEMRNGTEFYVYVDLRNCDRLRSGERVDSGIYVR